MKEMLVKARRGHYAVCYCEAWNLESLEAVVEAAEETRSPVIVGFGGGFLMQPERPYAEPLEYYAGLGLAAAHVASVPVALLLNETDSFDQIKRAIELGFNAIMVENERLSAGEYQELVREVVRYGPPPLGSRRSANWPTACARFGGRSSRFSHGSEVRARVCPINRG